MKLAVFPFRLRAANPLPEGFLPRLNNDCAIQYLYPDEDAKLMAAPAVPVSLRVFYGVLAREGFRSASELQALTLRDFDLAREGVALDENKTDDPRAWALTPGVAQAIGAMLAMRAAAGKAPIQPDDPLFVLEEDDGTPILLGTLRIVSVPISVRPA